MAEKVWHILNGDCAGDGWQESGLPGEVLIWRENYLHGESPDTDDLEAFCQVRARALHAIAPEMSEAAIFAELVRMNRQLLELPRWDRVTLWFDHCPFDRTLLARILYLLNTRTELPTIELICRDVAWDSAQFLRYRHEGIRLTRSELEYGAAQWRSFLTGAPPAQLLPRLIRENYSRSIYNV